VWVSGHDDLGVHSDRVREGGHGYFRSRLVRAETAAEIPSGGGEDNVQIERNAEAEVVCAALLALHELDENVYARNCTSTLR